VTGNSHFFGSLKERGSLRQHFVHDRRQHGSAARIWSSTSRNPASRPTKAAPTQMHHQDAEPGGYHTGCLS